MRCNTCKTGNSSLPGGCKNNWVCGINGCDKLNVFDWLANMKPPDETEMSELVEVRFKNGRKSIYYNINTLSLGFGEPVAVEASPGHDIGTVSLAGGLVKLQLQKHKQDENPTSHRKIYRIASRNDLKKWDEAKSREAEALNSAKQAAVRLNLDMKISDVEFQGDNTKATIYFTAGNRIDFRDLIKALKDIFKVKIEMKQLGARQEAGRLGGIGDCGREVCCAMWLTDFKTVTTGAARDQQLSIHPQKLSGQCGRLKCCLNYELDNYTHSLKDFPNTSIVLKTKRATAFFQKMDIFSRKLWYSYQDKPGVLIELSIENVHSVIEQNKQGKIPQELVSKSIKTPLLT